MPALLFDLDGTLIETDAIHRAVFVDLLRPHGIDVTEAFYAANLHGRLNTDAFADFLPDHPEPQRLSDDKEAEFRRRLPRPHPAMPGAAALLDRAAAEGWPVAVVTNAEPANAEAMLAAIGMARRFSVVVSGGDCARAKPDPAPYREAMRRLGVAPPDCIAFEDSPSGIRAAAASGAFAVAVRSSLTDAEARAHGADASIADFTDPALDAIVARLAGAVSE